MYLDRNDDILLHSNRTKPARATHQEQDTDSNDSDLVPSTLHNVPSVINRIDEDADVLSKGLRKEDIAFLRRVRESAHDARDRDTSLRDIVPMRHPKLADPPHHTSIHNKFSCDGFHIIDRPKIPVKHNAKKMYKVAFRDALFAWDDLKLDELKNTMLDGGFPESTLNDPEKRKHLQELMIEDG